MTNLNAFTRCNRMLQSKEIYRKDFNLDATEADLLTIARFYFQSFAVPESQAWMRALSHAESEFGAIPGPAVSMGVLKAIMAIRHARHSVYCFNSPTCTDCAAIITEHERRFMTALQAMRAQKTGEARTELMMLCEGNDTAPAIEALRQLIAKLPRLSNTIGSSAHG